MSDTKFCVDCKHFKRAWPGFGEGSVLYATCKSPKQGISIITKKPIIGFADINRQYARNCGRDATWFEPK